MATFNLNNGQVSFFDELTGKTGNDVYNISVGSTLVIDCDLRLSSNSGPALGPFASITIQATGGELLIDGRHCRLIPFDSGTGNVPAYGTVISQGNVTGRFAGVFSAINTAPVAVGAAMPATGFIRVTRVRTGGVDGGDFTSGGLTGIGANATGTSTVGFIEVCGVQSSTSTITVPRLGRATIRGEWLELGTTNGTRGQIINLPTLGQNGIWLPGVWIETAANSGVYEFFSAINVLTTTSNPAAAAVGNWTTADQATDARLRTVQGLAGQIRIGSDGTNDIGMLPPSGCRVRIPNVLLTSCLSASRETTTFPSNTIANNITTNTSSGGVLDFQNCIGSWNISSNQAFAVSFANMALANVINISECVSPVSFSNVHVGVVNNLASAALILTQNYAGGTVENSSFSRGGVITGGSHAVTLTSCIGFTFNNCRIQLLGNRNHNTVAYGVYIYACTNVDFTNTVITTGFTIATSTGCRITNTTSCDRPVGATTTANPAFGVVIAYSCQNITVNGWSFFGTNNHPYNALISLATSSNIKIRNIGTASNPLDMGAANPSRLFIFSNGVNENLEVKRCWAINYAFVFIGSSLAGISPPANNDTVCLIENCGSKSITQNFATLNCLSRGCRWQGASAAQVCCYGTHFTDYFETDTLGYIGILANERTDLTQESYTVTGGNPRFTSNGTVSMPNVGDRLVWEFPYYALGHSSFNTVTAPKFLATNYANFNIEYDVDINNGSGFTGTWQRAVHRVPSLAGSSGTTLRVSTTANVQIGDIAIGTSIPNGTSVVAIVNSTNLTLSNSVTGTVSGDISFSRLNAAPTFQPHLGFRLRLRATTLIANSANSISFVMLPTNTTLALQNDNLYPLDTALLQLTGLVPNSEVRCYVGTDPATSVEIGGVENSGTTFSVRHSVAGQAGYIVIVSLNYQNIRLPIVYSSDDISIPIQQVVDRYYVND